MKKLLIVCAALIVALTACTANPAASPTPRVNIVAEYDFVYADGAARNRDTMVKDMTVLEKRAAAMGYTATVNAAADKFTVYFIDGAPRDGAVFEKDFTPRGEVILREGDSKDGAVVFGNEQITSAQKKENGEIEIKLNADGRAKLADATERLVGKTISVWLDGEMLLNPTIHAPITGGETVISFGENNAGYENRLTAYLSGGSLSAPLKVAEIRDI